MKQDYEVLESDILVIGAGMAGLMAAIRAKDFVDKVVVVEKGKVTRSGVSVFCHAFGSPVPEGVREPLMKEMVERSAYLGDQAWFEILLQEVGKRANDMEKWGVVFERDKKGNLKIDAIRGQRIKVCALAMGKQLIEAMVQEALRRGVKFVERIAVTDLLTSDGKHPTQGHIVGAVGIHTRTGQFMVFKSGAVVIATGSMSAKLQHAYMDNVTGDGYAMAFRAGAELGGMEFAPVSVFTNWNRNFHTGGSGQFLHEGAKLVNRLGEEFLRKYPTASKESIGFEGHDDYGELCRAMAVEILEGRGPVYFDLRGWSQEKIDKIRKVLPFTAMAFDEAGVDMKQQLVESIPMCSIYATGCESGIRVNTVGGSTIGGLYAAGAAVMYGKGPLPQALSAVGGYRAGESAASWARDTEFADIYRGQAESLKQAVFSPLQRKEGISPGKIYYSVNKVVTPWGASLFKHEKRIRDVLAAIRQIARDDLPRMKAEDIHELVKATEATNFVLMMELVNIAALERKESRMVHYREDYPYTDNRDWLKWILLKNDGKDGVQLKIEPVPLGCHAIMPDSLSRKPSPIQFKMDRP